MFLNSFSSFLWGETPTSDAPTSRMKAPNLGSESHPRKSDSQIQMQQRKKVQTQMRKVHIEMWRENVRQSRQLRESASDAKKEIEIDEKMKRLQRIENRFVKELSRQLRFKDTQRGDLQLTIALPANDEIVTIIDEVEDDYVLLLNPN